MGKNKLHYPLVQQEIGHENDKWKGKRKSTSRQVVVPVLARQWQALVIGGLVRLICYYFPLFGTKPITNCRFQLKMNMKKYGKWKEKIEKEKQPLIQIPCTMLFIILYTKFFFYWLFLRYCGPDSVGTRLLLLLLLVFFYILLRITTTLN